MGAASAGQAPQPFWMTLAGLGQVLGPPTHLLIPCLAEEPTFRCDVCDELFQSKLDLRRHKKYACGSVGATLYESLGEELKPKGLGSGGSDGHAHECKDCERMFPNKYRCCPPPPHPSPGASQGSVGPQSTEGALTGQGLQGLVEMSVPSRVAHPRGRALAHSSNSETEQATGTPGPGTKARSLVRALSPGRPTLCPAETPLALPLHSQG